eukprot:3192630-Rhodomonas_salina.4
MSCVSHVWLAKVRPALRWVDVRDFLDVVGDDPQRSAGVRTERAGRRLEVVMAHVRLDVVPLTPARSMSTKPRRNLGRTSTKPQQISKDITECR